MPQRAEQKGDKKAETEKRQVSTQEDVEECKSDRELVGEEGCRETILNI